MPTQEDYEELCVRLREVVGRANLSADAKLDLIKHLLNGKPGAASTAAHRWRETGSTPLDDGSEGQSIQYACTRCGAKGYQIAFATSVTMYPIVSDSAECSG